jgi:Kef-type K+ transport system membrane component KefB
MDPRRNISPFLCSSLALLFLFLFARPVAASEEPVAHGDPVAPILITLVLISFGAALGGRWVRKMGQPAVLGELLVGMVVANVAYYFREPVITVLRNDEIMVQVMEMALSHDVSLSAAVHEVVPDAQDAAELEAILRGPAGPIAIAVQQFIDQLSRLAVIVLLFLVGLENSVREMVKVGKVSFLVAIIGVVCPFALGYGATRILLPAAPAKEAIFIGAILTATSVGITARVFRDLNQAQRTEAKVILGAAVIDDVLGLIILAVVSALVVTGAVNVFVVAGITLRAAIFLVGSIGIGVWITPRLVKHVARLEMEHVKLFFGLGFAFLLAWLANLFGLATIVGAFAAGLVLEELFLDELKGHSLRDMLSPLESLVVPVFFVLMGMQVKLETFLDWRVVLMATVLTAVAIIGKLVSGLACGPTMDRLSVGIGMMPRGEVGLIFASIGKGLGVVNDAVFSAVVIMVMITTLLTPALLKITLARSQKAS